MPKDSFILYCDMYDSMRSLADAQKAQLLDAIFLFHRGEDLPEMDGVVSMCFSFLSRIFKKNQDKYLERCEKASASARMRWHAIGCERTKRNAFDADNDLKDSCLSLKSSSQSKSLAISEGGTGGEDAPGQPDGCPTDTQSPATKKRKTSADHRPNACPVEQWEKYLAYSRKFLAEQHEQLGDMVKPDEAKAISGAKVLDTLIRVRGHPAAKVYRALEWAKADPFWVLQVRSLGGLLAKGKNGEEKFDNLCAAMIREAMQDERKNRSAA